MTAPAKKKKEFGSKHFINREIAWLKFNSRVLQEALRPTNPLLERLNFLGIVANNLDEFFEVRVASLEQKRASNLNVVDQAGLTPSHALRRIYSMVRIMVKSLYDAWNNDILPALSQEGYRIVRYKHLKDGQKEYIDRYFEDTIKPVLTPIVVDPAHPFPWLINKAVCIAGLIESPRSDEFQVAVVTIPRVLPRIITIPGGPNHNFSFLTSVVAGRLADLFPGYKIKGYATFRITRNSNLYLNEEELDDLLSALQSELHNRKRGDVVRLEVREGASPQLISYLREMFDLNEQQVHVVEGPVNFYRVMTFNKLIDRPDLKYPAFRAKDPDWLASGENIFTRIRESDLLMHHPYESFSAIVHLIEQAAVDKSVLAIKMTLYRTATDSPIMEALIQAAKQGKAVTVVLELKARFDEESNVNWAKYLMDHDVQVTYGIMHLKTHCKLLLVLRQEENKVVKYAHIGTGNYNHETARLYTDLSLFTVRDSVTREVSDVFNFLTSHSPDHKFKKLLVAPSDMKSRFLGLIKGEAKAAKAGKTARIVFKVNALQDPEIIEALYKASMAGVEIVGIVRGICCLKPGRKGYSDNIKIISIVGRYLEHARIYFFENAGNSRIFIGSADWMPRNLERRVEVIVPILDKQVEARLLQILDTELEDNFNARRSSSVWKAPAIDSRKKKTTFFSAQKAFMDEVKGAKNPGQVILLRPEDDA